MQLRQVKLYNTLSRSVDEFIPIAPWAVGIYCCGPTVYNYQHIGNLRTYIFEDVLVRTLRYAGYDVKHVMNITDVGHLVSDADEGEDKMLVAAKREGKSSKEVAEFYTRIFFDHCSWLNINRPDIVCKATEHIPQMLALISWLEQKGYAYQSGGNVYFDVSKFSDYGKLARLDLATLEAGSRIEVDQNKRHPLDFALWFTRSKFLDPKTVQQELQWDSPWGKGYPGWHIECSAMSMHYLGKHFDIHCGGIDHVPVHHTNEIAQSQGATGIPPCNIWMHGGFLVVDKAKMSKSTGGFLTLDKIKDAGFDPLSFRLFCLGGTYRFELSWHNDSLIAAQNSLRKLRNSVVDWHNIINEQTKTSEKKSATPNAAEDPNISMDCTEMMKQFDDAILTDLGTARALACLYEVVNDNKFSPSEKLFLAIKFDRILGLGIDTWQPISIDIPEVVLVLAEKREKARINKNWQEADSLRSQILNLGYVIIDTSDGPQIKPR